MIREPEPDPAQNASGHGQSGLTLIELVVTMSVFALVAVMGLQALSATLRLQDRAVRQDAQHAALAEATALLRRDIKSIVPMLFFPPGAQPRSAVLSDPDMAGFALSVGHPPRAARPGDPGLTGRVIWQLDRTSAQLTRTSWPTLTPLSATQQSPTQITLNNVTALTLRSFWTGLGWTQGFASPVPLNNAPRPGNSGADGDQTGAAPESYSDILPQMIEITLQTTDYGTLTLIETLR